MEIVFLLDTNTASNFIANNPPQVRRKLERAGLESTAISAITEAELRYGIARNPDALRRRKSVEAYLNNATILSWDSAAARAYSQLRAEQERKGHPLSVEDLMIAAHALSLGLILISSDNAFSFVDGLRTEDWTIA
jgi:tRNA(fMet)-specific endonuclease VapC